MRFNNHLKASKIFTKPSLEFIQSSRILPERSLLSSTRCTRVCRDTSFSKPTILNRSLNKTERLQKSLESIRAKRSKIILKRNYFNEKRNTKLFNHFNHVCNYLLILYDYKLLSRISEITFKSYLGISFCPFNENRGKRFSQSVGFEPTLPEGI